MATQPFLVLNNDQDVINYLCIHNIKDKNIILYLLHNLIYPDIYIIRLIYTLLGNKQYHYHNYIVNIIHDDHILVRYLYIDNKVDVPIHVVNTFLTLDSIEIIEELIFSEYKYIGQKPVIIFKIALEMIKHCFKTNHKSTLSYFILNEDEKNYISNFMSYHKEHRYREYIDLIKKGNTIDDILVALEKRRNFSMMFVQPEERYNTWYRFVHRYIGHNDILKNIDNIDSSYFSISNVIKIVKMIIVLLDASDKSYDHFINSIVFKNIVRIIKHKNKFSVFYNRLNKHIEKYDPKYMKQIEYIKNII